MVYLKGFCKKFCAFWTNIVAAQVKIRDFVILVLENAQKIGVSGSVTSNFGSKPGGLAKDISCLLDQYRCFPSRDL